MSGQNKNPNKKPTQLGSQSLAIDPDDAERTLDGDILPPELEDFLNTKQQRFTPSPSPSSAIYAEEIPTATPQDIPRPPQHSNQGGEEVEEDVGTEATGGSGATNTNYGTVGDGEPSVNQPHPSPSPSFPPRQLPTTIAGPLRMIQYSAIKDRISLIEQLYRTIPHNHLNLPEFIYRPDLLNPHDFNVIPDASRAHELQQQLATAIVHISYAQGFPALSNTTPFWGTLPWETNEQWMALTEFLELPGIRSLHSMTSLPPEDLAEWYTLNYWGPRAKAFDLFKAAHHQRQRIKRIMEVENDHFEKAGKLLAKVAKRIDNMSDDDINNIEPLQAATIMEKLVKVQRVSLGLSAVGGDTEKSTHRKVESTEDLMRTISHTPHQQTMDQQGIDETVDLLREAPEVLEQAQAMILQLNRVKNTNPFPEDN